jgi:hypothetical protein
LLGHEPLPCARVERRHIRQTPARPKRFLPPPPAACDRVAVGPPRGGEKRQPQLGVPGCERRRTLCGTMEAPAVHNHDARCAGVAPEGQPLMALGTPALRIHVGADLLEDVRGALGDGTQDAEPPPAGHAALPAIAAPHLTFAGCCAVALAVAQWACPPAITLSTAPPASPRAGQAPHDRLLFLEHHDLPLAGTILPGGAGA